MISRFEGWWAMTQYGTILLLVTLLLLTGAGCNEERSLNVNRLINANVPYARHDLVIRQELVNDAPLGPGEPQPSDHCPTGPGQWFSGSGRSTATSTIFGDLTEVEVYCINIDRAELSGGLATWIAENGDTISMTFAAKLLDGFVYAAAPNAPMVGFAQFTGGTGEWAGITGAAFLTGRQNGDGTSTLIYEGTIYVPQ